MSDVSVRSLEYLKHLSRLIEGWEEDSACQCCDWAAAEIERLRAIVCDVRDTGDQYERDGEVVIILPRAVWMKAVEAAKEP
jgi:hypothetical protein